MHVCAAPGEANGGPEPHTSADNASSGSSVVAFTALFIAVIIILSWTIGSRVKTFTKIKRMKIITAKYFKSFIV